VVEAVRQESRVAWALLRSASVLSLEDGVLTLRFPREGEIKAFSVSGHDAVLKRVLSSDFGLDVMVRGVTGADTAARPSRSPAGPAADQAAPPPPAPRSRYEPSPADEAPYDEAPYDEPDEPEDTVPGDPDPAPAPRGSELSGMDLIQRELGGQVIGEIED
jgi:DNA polymerase III subunit gamma/tau